jgi:hypothetical protein
VVGEGTKHVHLHLGDAQSGRRGGSRRGAFSIWTFDWAPDGSRIAFDRGPGTGLDDFYRTDLATVRIEDGEEQPLVTRRGFDRHPIHSPDGNRVSHGERRARVAGRA